MVTVEQIAGWEDDEAIAGELHRLAHLGLVDELLLGPDDAGRHRLRATTSNGVDLAISLPRDQRLADGAVLVLARDGAVVVRMADQAWLRLAPADLGAALELGHRAGHLHWRVHFEGPVLAVAVRGDGVDERVRVADLVEAGRVCVEPVRS